MTKTVLTAARVASLGPRLEHLLERIDAQDRLQADPIAFPRRYRDPLDAEIAGLVAAMLAYGRVDLFRPVVARVLAEADAHGGPRAYVCGFDPDRHAAALHPLIYRWNRGIDLVLLFAALRRLLTGGASVQDLFRGWRPSHPDVRIALAQAVDALRDAAVAEAPRCGVPASRFDELPRGFRTLLPSPRDGSACKRWNMYLRWMVRPATDGVDLGLWTALPPSALVVPLDTHVARVSRFIGLTRRGDGSWRTAAEITRNLRRFDRDDPVRFDFALAHLGMSGSCKGRFAADVCPSCPLAGICVEALAA